jgi:hypothetical protein
MLDALERDFPGRFDPDSFVLWRSRDAPSNDARREMPRMRKT